MRSFGILILSLFIFNSWAKPQRGGMKNAHMEDSSDMDFETHKKMMTERVTMKIKNLEEMKSCIDSADDKDGLKQCKKNMKGKMSTFRDQNKGHGMKKSNRKKMRKMKMENDE